MEYSRTARGGTLGWMGLTAVEPTIALHLRLTQLSCRLRRCRQIRRIEVILAGVPPGEQGIAPGIGQRRPIRCGVTVSLTADRLIEAIHSPEAWAERS